MRWNWKHEWWNLDQVSRICTKEYTSILEPTSVGFRPKWGGIETTGSKTWSLKMQFRPEERSKFDAVWPNFVDLIWTAAAPIPPHFDLIWTMRELLNWTTQVSNLDHRNPIFTRFVCSVGIWFLIFLQFCEIDRSFFKLFCAFFLAFFLVLLDLSSILQGPVTFGHFPILSWTVAILKVESCAPTYSMH